MTCVILRRRYAGSSTLTNLYWRRRRKCSTLIRKKRAIGPPTKRGSRISSVIGTSSQPSPKHSWTTHASCAAKTDHITVIVASLQSILRNIGAKSTSSTCELSLVTPNVLEEIWKRVDAVYLHPESIRTADLMHSTQTDSQICLRLTPHKSIQIR